MCERVSGNMHEPRNYAHKIIIILSNKMPEGIPLIFTLKCYSKFNLEITTH